MSMLFNKAASWSTSKRTQATDGRLVAGSHSKNCLKLVFLDKKVSII